MIITTVDIVDIPVQPRNPAPMAGAALHIKHGAAGFVRTCGATIITAAPAGTNVLPGNPVRMAHAALRGSTTATGCAEILCQIRIIAGIADMSVPRHTCVITGIVHTYPPPGTGKVLLLFLVGQLRVARVDAVRVAVIAYRQAGIAAHIWWEQQRKFGRVHPLQAAPHVLIAKIGDNAGAAHQHKHS